MRKLFNLCFILRDPLEQFDIHGLDKIFAKWYAFVSLPETADQISANLTVSLFILLIVGYYTIKNKKIHVESQFVSVSTFIRYSIISLFNSFFKNMGYETIKYGILISSMFIIILLSNILSLLIPTGETITSHIILNFTLSFIGIVTMAIRYLHKCKLTFFSIFVLQGVPLLILPFLILIETISYFARLISLAVRLFANITAGHVLVSLFGFVLLKLLSALNLLSLLVIPFFVAILTLEFLVAFLQTYVFTVLLTSYLEELEHHI